MFYSERPDDIEQAKAICSGCVLAVRCGIAAISRHERFGVWAGLAAPEREALVREVRRRASS